MESSPAPSEPTAISPALTELYQQVKSGANWFYWIAGLSIVNAVLAHSDTKIQFVLGLAITQVIDFLIAQIAPNAKWFSLVFDIALAGAMGFFGYKGGQAVLWAFYVGLGIFVVDCGLFGWLCYMGGEVNKGVLLGSVFRLVALFSIIGGIGAARKLHALKTQMGAAGT